MARLSLRALRPDSGFMSLMTRAADLMILNLLFLLTSLPVVTAGASAAARYSMIFAMDTSREAGVLRSYFRAFRENFPMATKAWLLLLAVSGLLLADVFLAEHLGGLFAVGTVIFWILLILAQLAASMIFPLIALFRNTLKLTVKNGIVLALGNLPRAAVCALLWIFPVLVLVRMPLTFFYAAFLWIVIWFSGAAYLCRLLLKRVFDPYLPDEEMEETE